MSNSNSMPKPDVALREFFRDNEIFAALFNGYFFESKDVIDPKELETEDTAYAESVNANLKIEKINKYRDLVRKTSNGYLIILGIEDQNKIHYAMPIRKMLYDVLGYSSELSSLGKMQDKKSWTVDERLSNISKGTKVTPIITVVFYTGEDEWDGPKSLHDMMDIDDVFRPYIPDYPLYIIDMGHDKNLSFPNKELEELRHALTAIYAETADRDETEIDGSIIALAGILSGDIKLYRAVNDEGRQPMCRALDKRDERIYLQFKDKLEEKDAVIEEKDAALEAKDAALGKKDAEIAALKAQIEALKNNQ